MSGISRVFLVSGSGKQILASKLYIDEVVISPLSESVGHGYLQHVGQDWNRSHRLNYHLYFISIEVQLNDATLSAYGDSITDGATHRAKGEAATVVETYVQYGEDVEGEEGVVVPEMGI